MIILPKVKGSVFLKSVIFLVLLIMIVVIVFLTRRNEPDNLDMCFDIEGNDVKQQCWAKQVEGRVLSKGTIEGLKLVYELSIRNKYFAENCHDYVHIVGKSAYKIFAETKKIDFSDKMSICSYGFYHGFMDSLVGENGDVAMARELCQKIKEKSHSGNLACFHGIGHGWSGTHDKSLWGDEMAMVKPALEMCEKVTSDPHELLICATGVFDSISLAYYNHLYGLEINKEDPLWLCRKQKENYKEPCYMDMIPALVWLTDYDLLKSVEYLDTVDPRYRNLVVGTIADNIVRFTLNRGQELYTNILRCKSLAGEYIDSCVTGTVKGAIQFGKVGSEYAQGLSLCEDIRMVGKDKERCFEIVFVDAASRYSAQKFDEICSLKSDYRKYCDLVR